MRQIKKRAKPLDKFLFCAILWLLPKAFRQGVLKKRSLVSMQYA